MRRIIICKRTLPSLRVSTYDYYQRTTHVVLLVIEIKTYYIVKIYKPLKVKLWNVMNCPFRTLLENKFSSTFKICNLFEFFYLKKWLTHISVSPKPGFLLTNLLANLEFTFDQKFNFWKYFAQLFDKSSVLFDEYIVNWLMTEVQFSSFNWLDATTLKKCQRKTECKEKSKYETLNTFIISSNVCFRENLKSSSIHKKQDLIWTIMSHCEDRAIIFKYIILVLDCYDLRKILWAWFKKKRKFCVSWCRLCANIKEESGCFCRLK